MPTILELFKNKELNFPGGSTADGLVDSAAEENRGGFKQQVTNFVQQELTGIRIKSLVDVNNPLIYGNQAVRIAQRTTPDKDEMKEGRGVNNAGGGLNLNKGISAARDAVNTFLGIPETMLPSRIIKLDGAQDAIKGSGTPLLDWTVHQTNTAVTREGYGKNGTGLGALLKNSAGNPSTLGKQAVGGAIGAAKKGLRGALFGKPGELADALPKFTPKREFYDVGTGGVMPASTFTQGGNNHYSKLLENGGEPEKVTERMGIGMTGLADAGQTVKVFKVPEKADDKLIVPFWIQGITEPDADRVFFRTVISGLSETSTPTWTGSKFLGNPYNYYIYEGVDRAVTFNLNVYCMSATDLIINWNKLQYLTSKVYPKINNDVMDAPFIKFQIGDIYKERIGFIESLTYTMPDTGTWEIDTEGAILPKFIDVALTIKLVETPGVEDKLYDFEGDVDGYNFKKPKTEDFGGDSKTAPAVGGLGGFF